MSTAGYLRFDTTLDTNGFNKGINDITNSTKKGGSTLKSIIGGVGIERIIEKGIGAIKNSLDGAISRFDTLRNYPKVMESLGYASEDAKKSIDKLSDGIEGLPTALDEIVSSAQSFTATLGDMEKGTETAIAVNDLFLASGKGLEDINRATEAYNKILAKGKPEMENWQSMVEVAPAQMQQLATTLVGAGANQRDLYNALKDGTVSLEDFNNAIIDLDQNGGEGFSSFSEQAKNATDGIATSIANVKTAIVKNVEKIIGAINDKLKELGLGSISENINKIKGFINDFGKVAIKVIPEIIETIYKLRYAIVGVAGAIGTAKLAMAGVSAGKSILGIVQGFQDARVQASLYRMEVGKTSSIQTLFNKDLTGTQKMFAIMQNSKVGQTMSSIGDKAKSGASGVLQFVKAHKGLTIGLGLAGVAIGGMVALYKKAGGDANKMADMITDKVNDIVNIIQSIASKVPEIINKVLPKIINVATKVLPDFINTIVSMIPTVIPVLINGLITLVTALTQAIPVLIPPLINGLIMIIMALVNSIGILLPPLIEGAIQIIMALVEALPTIIDALIQALPMIITMIITALIKLLPELCKGLIQLVIGIVKNLPMILKALIKEIPNIIKMLVSTALSYYKYLLDLGVKFIKFIWNGFKSWLGNFWQKIKDFVKSIPDKVKSALTNIKDIGKNLVHGIWNGIKNAKDWVLDKIKGFGKSILKGMKKALGINSPSIFTKEMGINLDEGIILGIDKEKRKVLNTIGNFGDDILNKMRDAVSVQTGNMNASAMLKANASYNNAIVLNASFNGEVDIDGKKAGRILAPEVVKTIKTAGGN